MQNSSKKQLKMLFPIFHKHIELVKSFTMLSVMHLKLDPMHAKVNGKTLGYFREVYLRPTKHLVMLFSWQFSEKW